MPHWQRGEQTVRFLLGRGRLETLEAVSLDEASDALLERANRRHATAQAAIELGDLAGAYSTAYDAYRIAAESLLARQALRATGGNGSHVTVEDAVSAQFAAEIPAFAKATFEQLRRTRHSVQYFDPDAAPVTDSDTRWAIDKAAEALSGVGVLLSQQVLDRFS
jgi:HEPN domain